MIRWAGTKNKDGDTCTGSNDLIQDEFSGGIGQVKMLQLNFIAIDDIRIQVDDDDPLWLEAGDAISFGTEHDLTKMPSVNFKLLTSGAKYRYFFVMDHLKQ